MNNRLALKGHLRTAGIAAAAVLALGVSVPAAASATTIHHNAHLTTATTAAAKPTIVLVHGAWADASTFGPITKRLQRDGYPVRNAPNALRGLASDASDLAAYVNQSITGPVVLVGQS